MTDQPVLLDDLLVARDDIKEEIVKRMPDEHRQFLLSFERGEPDWPLLGIPGAQDLPAILWRQRNLNRLDTTKRADLIRSLEKVLQP